MCCLLTKERKENSTWLWSGERCQEKIPTLKSSFTIFLCKWSRWIIMCLKARSSISVITYQRNVNEAFLGMKSIFFLWNCKRKLNAKEWIHFPESLSLSRWNRRKQIYKECWPVPEGRLLRSQHSFAFTIS